MSKSQSLRKRIIDIWKILNVANRNSWHGHFLGDDLSRIKPLVDDLEALMALEPELTSNKTFMKVLELANKRINGRVLLKKRWYIKFFRKLSQLVEQWGIYIQEKNIKDWGRYKLSEIFPHTWKYLKEYVPLRYPEYLLKGIPDTHISLGTFSQPYLPKAHGDQEYKAIIYPTGNPEKDTILVNLTRFCPGPMPRSKRDIMKCVKYIDRLPKNSVVIIHEYEHGLQKLKDKLPKSIGIRHPIPKYVISRILGRIPIFIPLAIGLTRLSKDFRRMMVE